MSASRIPWTWAPLRVAAALGAAIAFGLLLAGCGGKDERGRDRSAWPQLLHKAGVFAFAEPAHFGEAARIGVQLSIINLPGYDVSRQGGLRAGLRRYGMRYIDNLPWRIIREHYSRACGRVEAPHCRMNPAQEAALEQEFRLYLEARRDDPHLVGYYVLDDSPGDVRQTLARIRSLIHESNRQSRIRRPAICGFGGRLDSRPAPSAPFRAPADAVMNLRLNNYSPAGCDAVIFYPYAGTAGVAAPAPESYDWSMASLLERFKRRLSAAGWDPDRAPLIGAPQAFSSPGYLTPTRQTVAAQTEAFCRGGAKTIVAFAWTGPGTPPQPALADDPQLREGLREGVAACRRLWSDGG